MWGRLFNYIAPPQLYGDAVLSTFMRRRFGSDFDWEPHSIGHPSRPQTGD